MTSEDEQLPQTKFSAMSDMSKEILSKSVEVTKSSSKKALEYSKKITQDGLEQAKEGLTTLSEKKNEYLAKRDKKKLEQSIIDFDSRKVESKSGFPSTKSPGNVDSKSSELDLIKEQIKQIEHEFPTVLSEENFSVSPPSKKRIKWPNTLASLLLLFFALITLIHTLIVISSSNETSLLAMILRVIVPSWLSNPSPLGNFNEWQFVLGIITTAILIVCSVLMMFNSNLPSRILAIHYVGVLCLGQLVFIFYSDNTFDILVLWDAGRDFVKALVVVGIARTPHQIQKVARTEAKPTIFDYTGILAKQSEKQYTPDELATFIEEGLSMDFRTEVAKPKPPRARAKFEGYEIILLCVSTILWPMTIVMTMAYDGGLSPYMDYTSGPIQVVAVWALSLLTLLSLVRFDRSARGNGWYAKEKETYVGMMDLYSKAQAKHYEYVELRAAAEAQEILEKYPQLDTSKSGKSSRA